MDSKTTQFGHVELLDRTDSQYVSKETVTRCCISTIETHCTRLCGGDASHGAFASIEIKNNGSFTWAVEIEHGFYGLKRVKIAVGGDDEQRNLAEMLREAARAIESQLGKPGNHTRNDDLEPMF
ncbi:MAG: hypothetical protein U5L04_01490 [Trueperaceae bacterium]|nr:hypothetical protein [Trueperaceae bacterium]